MRCVHLLYFTKWAREITEVSRRIRVTTVKKCTKKRDARVKLLFCYLNLLLFDCSRCCHRHRYLSFLLLWSKNFATMVTWRHASFYMRRGCPYHCNTTIISGIITGYGPVFSLVLGSGPSSLCESSLGPVSLSFVKWRMPLLNREEKSLRHDAMVATTRYCCDPQILLPW